MRPLKNLLPLLSSFLLIFIYSEPCYGVSLSVLSDKTSEPLPFSIIRIPNIGVWRTDSLGNVSINLSKTKIRCDLMISSFGHMTKEISVPLDSTDNLVVRLQEVSTPLPDVTVLPLIKEKDITMGRQTLNLGFINTTEFNIDPTYPMDSITGRIYENELGVEFKAAKGRINRLKTFGINVIPTKSMIEELTFILEIYDMTRTPADSNAVPQLAYPPIRVKYRSDLVNRKKKEFRYEFPEPIDLPKECIVIVSLTWFDENGKSNLKGSRLRAHTTRNCLFYKEGNPYKLAFPPFLSKKLPSPFFWEYTSYIINEDQE